MSLSLIGGSTSYRLFVKYEKKKLTTQLSYLPYEEHTSHAMRKVEAAYLRI
jgi:hypothetical protein